MFRKIRSNRAPDRTIPVELYREFRPYLVLMRRQIVQFLKAYPKQLFALMVMLLVFSVLYSFGVLPRKDKEAAKAVASTGTEKRSGQSYPMSEGLSKISSTGIKLRKTLEIRKQVDSVLGRETLNSNDSAFLEAKLEELRKLR